MKQNCNTSKKDEHFKCFVSLHMQKTDGIGMDKINNIERCRPYSTSMAK